MSYGGSTVDLIIEPGNNKVVFNVIAFDHYGRSFNERSNRIVMDAEDFHNTMESLTNNDEFIGHDFSFKPLENGQTLVDINGCYMVMTTYVLLDRLENLKERIK